MLAPTAPPKPAPTATYEAKPAVTSSVVSSGAASAPAPAREPAAPKVEEKPATSAAADLFEQPATAAPSEPSTYVGAAPSFSFGGATAESESSGGGSKKAFLGVAALALIAAGGYFAWSHLKGSGASSAQQMAVTSPAAPSAAAKPVSAPPAAAGTELTKPSPVSQPDITIGNPSGSSSEESESSTTSTASRATNTGSKSTNGSSAAAKPAAAEKAPVVDEAETAETAETPALVVKGGKAPSIQARGAAPEAPAPSVIGMGTPEDASLPNLGTPTASVKPTLQTLSVSQGVSQGLLLKKVAPSYPQNALRMHIEGMVELLATISKTGEITKIKVVSGDAQLTRAASDAVKQWKYKPYLLNGEPVEIQTQVTVNFKLPH